MVLGSCASLPSTHPDARRLKRCQVCPEVAFRCQLTAPCMRHQTHAADRYTKLDRATRINTLRSDVPFSISIMKRSTRYVGATPIGVHVTKAAITGDHVRHALFDRVVFALPHHFAGAEWDDCAPWSVAISPNGGNAETYCRRNDSSCNHQLCRSFHREGLVQ